jgi:hypothetical protein
MNARRLNSFNCIRSLPAKAKLQDIELASIGQQRWSWGRGAEHEGGRSANPPRPSVNADIPARQPRAKT